MKTRKIILIVADLILLAVCIVQGIIKAKDNVKTFTFTDRPNEIVIERADGTFNLIKRNEEWFIGEDKFPANDDAVEVLIDLAKNIRALDRMGKVSNPEIAARYDLGDGKKIVVTMKYGDKILRTLTVGKESSTGTQSYLTIDNGEEVYLVADNLHATYDKTIEDLRSKTVFQLNKNSITGVSITDANGNTWGINRIGEGENLTWTVSGTEIEVDGSVATEWFNSLAVLNTTKWLDSKEKFNGTKYGTMRIFYDNKTISMDIFEIPAVGDAKPVCYAYCSETPYPFELPSYSISKFKKVPEDLAK